MNILMYQQFFDAQNTHWWFSTRKKIVLDTIKNFDKNIEEKNILDIGCGCGVMLNSLSELGATAGLDMSDEAINFCSQIFGGVVKKGSLPDQIPYPKNTFNLITALDVIEHIDEDQRSLSAIHDLLLPEGVLIVTVPAYQFLWSKFDDMNEHKRRYTRSELRKKLETTGFRVEKISYFNSILFPVVYAVRTINKLFGRDGASDVDLPNAPMNAFLKKVFGLEMHFLRRINIPFGVSLIAVAKKEAKTQKIQSMEVAYD